MQLHAVDNADGAHIYLTEPCCSFPITLKAGFWTVAAHRAAAGISVMVKLQEGSRVHDRLIKRICVIFELDYAG